MNVDKELGGDLCKSHSARSEKEFCRVCPSNLNKKELENVYFTLLENNMDLKTTVNNQREKIKILSTKIQRLTMLQKTYLGKEPKECCGSKAVISEQKECISELRRTNQCLSERVRQLNMRLCSAKQFLKRSPFQSTSRCNRCSNKNVSMSALITKGSETNLRTAVASSQYLVKDILSSRTGDNEIISHEKGVQYNFCEENKCRDRIEELKKKNEDLEEELTRIKENHNSVTSQLERDLADLRAENVRMRSDRTFEADRSELLRTQLAEVTMRLGSADLRSDELTVELAIERRKVTELETRFKAADMSSRIASAIETHLTSIKMAKDQTNIYRDIEASRHEKLLEDDSSKFLEIQSPSYKPRAAVRTKVPHVQVEEVFKNSDDSGYTEINKSQEVDDTKASTYLNQVLLEKIADLQNQINKMKALNNDDSKPAYELVNVSQKITAKRTEEYTTTPDKQQSDENIISESSESLSTEKKSNINIMTTVHSKTDTSNDNESISQLINNINKLTETDPGHTNNASEKHQSHLNGDIKVRESFKRFKRRNKDGSKTLSDDRKLSLQYSRDFLKEKNLIKTGSLDENRIDNTDIVTIDSFKRFEAKKITIKGLNEKYTRKSNNDIVNTEKVIAPDKAIQNKPEERVNQSDTGNNVAVGNIENTTKNYAMVEKKTDSDSSKGTYSIHREENVSKLTTKTKEEFVNINKENNNNNIACHQNRYTLAADGGQVLSRVHRRRSVPSQVRQAARNLSPDSTECEISSLSDLPDERNSSSRSPGEERPPTVSESRTDTTTDYGSLSEGELPYLRDITVLSDGERRVCKRTGKSLSVPTSTARQMEETLAAVELELGRCTALLHQHTQRSLDAGGL